MNVVTSKSLLKRRLPDVSHEAKVEITGVLEKVGMEDIETPISIEVDGQVISVPARVNAYVSLDKKESKGIHMSRLYLAIKRSFSAQPLSKESLEDLLKDFVMNQDGLSEDAYVHIKFELPLNRKALLSEQSGWRLYPVELKAHYKKGQLDYEICGQIMYSSTCPCSAALARQLIQEKFKTDFGDQELINADEVALWLDQEKSIVATPHAQRSFATFKVKINSAKTLPTHLEFIDLIERVLATPVQTAVKREDEQEFARLNAENLMFCEDAARKIKNAFENDGRINDYYIHVDHRESLHPHNAVAVSVKGIENGYKA